MSAGTLIEFSGLPATGKSTLSRQLAAELGAVLMRIDEIEAAMRRNGLTAQQTGVAAYSVAHDVAAGHLRRGFTVIADAVSPVEEARAGWRELARSCEARHLVIETQCLDLAEHRHRVETRVSDLPGWVYPSWDELVERMREYQPRIDDRLVVETNRPITVCYREVTVYVSG